MVNEMTVLRSNYIWEFDSLPPTKFIASCSGYSVTSPVHGSAVRLNKWYHMAMIASF